MYFCWKLKDKQENKDAFQELADRMVIYQIRSKWLAISKMYNELASEQDGTIPMAFVLLTVHAENGTPVTKIAPRMGMEPNSLSRILKSMEKKGLLYKRRSRDDKRKVFINLTDHGKAMREVSMKAVFSFENTIQNNVTEKDLLGFFKVMSKIPQVMELISGIKE